MTITREIQYTRDIEKTRYSNIFFFIFLEYFFRPKKIYSSLLFIILEFFATTAQNPSRNIEELNTVEITEFHDSPTT